MKDDQKCKREVVDISKLTKYQSAMKNNPFNLSCSQKLSRIPITYQDQPQCETLARKTKVFLTKITLTAWDLLMEVISEVLFGQNLIHIKVLMGLRFLFPITMDLLNLPQDSHYN